MSPQVYLGPRLLSGPAGHPINLLAREIPLRVNSLGAQLPNHLSAGLTHLCGILTILTSPASHGDGSDSAMMEHIQALQDPSLPAVFPTSLDALKSMLPWPMQPPPDAPAGVSLTRHLAKELNSVREEIQDRRLAGLVGEMRRLIMLFQANLSNDLHDYHEATMVHEKVLAEYEEVDEEEFDDEKRIGLVNILLSMARNMGEQGRIQDALSLLGDALASLPIESTGYSVATEIDIILERARLDYLRYDLAGVRATLALAREKLNDYRQLLRSEEPLAHHVELLDGIVHFCSGAYGKAIGLLSGSVDYFERTTPQYNGLRMRATRFLDLAKLMTGDALTPLPDAGPFPPGSPDLGDIVSLQAKVIFALQYYSKRGQLQQEIEVARSITELLRVAKPIHGLKICFRLAQGKIHSHIAGQLLLRMKPDDPQVDQVDKEFLTHVETAIESYRDTGNRKGLAKAIFLRAWWALLKQRMELCLEEFHMALAMADEARLVNAPFNFVREVALCVPNGGEGKVQREFWCKLDDACREYAPVTGAAGVRVDALKHMLLSTRNVFDFRESEPQVDMSGALGRLSSYSYFRWRHAQETDKVAPGQGVSR